MRNLYLIVFILATATLANAQTTTLRGKVILEDSTAAVSASVLLMEADSTNMVDFTTADENGNYELPGLPQGAFILQIQYIGYKPYYGSVQLTQPEQRHPQVVLESFAIVGAMAEVEAELMGMKRRGDTLMYLPEVYKDGTERTLGDVVNALPGMEVDEQGDITMDGERVDKVTVENKEVSDQQRNLTEGINAKDVQALDVWKEDDETTVVDVKLTEDAKSKPSGSIALAGGMPERFLGEASLYKITSKLGFTAFLRGNNAGEPVLSYNDLMQMTTGGFRSFGRRGGGSIFSGNTGLTEAINLPQKLQLNRDVLGNINTDWTITDAWTLKAAFTGASLHREAGGDFTRLYNDSPIPIAGEERSTYDFQLYNGDVRLEHRFAEHWEATLRAPVSYNNSDRDEQYLMNSVSDAVQDLILQSRESNLTATPSLNFRYRPSRDITGRAYVNTKFVTNERDANFLGQDSLFGQGGSTYLQEWRQTQQQVQAGAAYSYRAKEAWQWSLEPQYNYDAYEVDVTESPTEAVQPNGTERYLRQQIGFDGSLTYNFDQWSWRNSFAPFYTSIEHLEQERDVLLYNVSSRLTYSFQQWHTISVEYSQGESAFDFEQVRRSIQVQYPWEARRSLIDATTLQRSRTVSLQYSRRDFSSNSSLFATLSYDNTFNDAAFATTFGEELLLVEQLLVPRNTTYSGNVNYSSRYKWGALPIRLNSNLRYSYSESFIPVTPEVFRPVDNQSLNGSLRLRTQRKYKLNGGIRYTSSLVERQFGGANRNNFLWTNAIFATARRGWKSGWVAKAELGRDFRSGAFGDQQLTILDAEVSYKIPETPFELTLIGNNILNLNQPELIAANFTPAFQEYTTFLQFPGYVVLEGRWRF